MRIAFFGLREFSDYHHISGFQSFLRRIANELIKKGIQVDYILYNSGLIRQEEPETNLKIKYYNSFQDAFKSLSCSSYDHIINIRLSRFDRVRLPLYKRLFLPDSHYHYLAFVWPDSSFKRHIVFGESLVLSRKGKIVTVSPRLFRALRQLSNNVYYLLPPVPRDYFLEPDEKPNNEKIKILYLGVLYPDKGIEDVLEVFKYFSSDPKFELLICAIYEPRNKKSVEMRHWLKNQTTLKYIEVDRYNYSPETENMAGRLLKEADIMIQPYRNISATVDTPILLLEAMASLCAVITTPIGSIPEIYGSSDFLIDTRDGIASIISFLKKVSYVDILEERQRIFNINRQLEYESGKVAENFIKIISGAL
ncbi:glycosyltransferase [candidate division CSSED10-310 bacterium]|uniref:Glycosyltransferase n=1 Tax=candidate division CSSED10-310 bacterium TaxID=2855610 RepID=A0ABV6YVM4_UNCC1